MMKHGEGVHYRFRYSTDSLSYLDIFLDIYQVAGEDFYKDASTRSKKP